MIDFITLSILHTSLGTLQVLMKVEYGKFVLNFQMLILTSLLQQGLLTRFSTQMLMNCEFTCSPGNVLLFFQKIHNDVYLTAKERKIVILRCGEKLLDSLYILPQMNNFPALLPFSITLTLSHTTHSTFRSGSVCLDVINQSWSPMFGIVNHLFSFPP